LTQKFSFFIANKIKYGECINLFAIEFILNWLAGRIWNLTVKKF
jgi:hypothetical protein